MTETEIVAQTIAPEVFECPKINLNKPAYDRAYARAQAAITALDKHRIKRAGEVGNLLRRQMCNKRGEDDCGCNLCSVLAQAAATIASLRDEIERLTERDGGGGA